MGRPVRILLILLGGGLLLTGWMLREAMSEPVVRRASLAMPDWPAGASPVQVAFLSDVHVAGPDMPPSRLRQIVDQVNALKPDLVLFGGDFVSDKRVATKRYAASVALAPLKHLRAPLGAYAVLGNHDHWRSAPEITAALQAASVRPLQNGAARVGPLVLGGVDDDFTGRADISTTVSQMRASAGARVLLSHSPDIVPAVPSDVSLILAGHTHCGQIRLPFIGALAYMSEYGDRFACGIIVEGFKRIIVSAGAGTSLLPLRLGTPPDLWLLTLGPARARPPTQAQGGSPMLKYAHRGPKF